MPAYEVTVGNIYLVEAENQDAAIESAIDLFRKSGRVIGVYAKEIDGATSIKDLIVTKSVRR